MSNLFSVIIPVYNVKPFLQRCLDSVWKQSYHDFEVVIVDDGSTDGSGRICDQYAERYSQCKVIHQENKGLAAARNTGLQYASGKYILFVDSDDYIEKEMLTKAYYYMEEQGYDTFSFAMRRVNEQGEYLFEMAFIDGIGSYSLHDRKNFLLTLFLQYKLGWEACIYVYRRDLIERKGIRFVENMKYAEDMPFTFEYMLYAKNAIKIPDMLYNYTRRDASITQMISVEQMVDGIFKGVFEVMWLKVKEESYLYYAALLKYFVPTILQTIDIVKFREIMKCVDNQQLQKKQWESIIENKAIIQFFWGKTGKKICDVAKYLLNDKRKK